MSKDLLMRYLHVMERVLTLLDEKQYDQAHAMLVAEIQATRIMFQAEVPD